MFQMYSCIKYTNYKHKMVTCLELCKNDIDDCEYCRLEENIIKFIMFSPNIICMILFFYFMAKKHVIGTFLISIFFIFLTENSFF